MVRFLWRAGGYLRPPKLPLPRFPPPLVAPPWLLPPRLPLTDGFLEPPPLFIEGLDVLRFGLKVLLGFLCIPAPWCRLLLLNEAVPRLFLFVLAVVRVLLSRWWRWLLRLPLKPRPGLFLSFLLFCGRRLTLCFGLSPLVLTKCLPPPLPPRWNSPRSKRSRSPCPLLMPPWWNVRPLYQLRPPLCRQLCPPR